jgi:hypothetical protein
MDDPKYAKLKAEIADIKKEIDIAENEKDFITEQRDAYRKAGRADAVAKLEKELDRLVNLIGLLGMKLLYAESVLNSDVPNAVASFKRVDPAAAMQNAHVNVENKKQLKEDIEKAKEIDVKMGKIREQIADLEELEQLHPLNRQAMQRELENARRRLRELEALRAPRPRKLSDYDDGLGPLVLPPRKQGEGKGKRRRRKLKGGDLGDDIRRALDPNRNGLNQSIQNTNAAINQSVQDTGRRINESVQNTGRVLGDAFDPNKNGLAAAVNSIGDKLKGVDWNDVKNKLGDSLDPAKNGVSEAFNKFGGDATRAFEELGNKIKESAQRDKATLDTAFAPFVAEFTNPNSALAQFAQSAGIPISADEWKKKFEDPETYFTILSVLVTAAASVASAGLAGPATFAAAQALIAGTRVITKAAMGKPITAGDIAAVVTSAVPVPGGGTATTWLEVAKQATKKVGVSLVKTAVKNVMMSKKDGLMEAGKTLATMSQAATPSPPEDGSAPPSAPPPPSESSANAGPLGQQAPQEAYDLARNTQLPVQQLSANWATEQDADMALQLQKKAAGEAYYDYDTGTNMPPGAPQAASETDAQREEREWYESRGLQPPANPDNTMFGKGGPARGLKFAPMKYDATDARDPWFHMKARAAKVGRKVRLNRLDPDYFEGKWQSGVLDPDYAMRGGKPPEEPPEQVPQAWAELAELDAEVQNILAALRVIRQAARDAEDANIERGIPHHWYQDPKLAADELKLRQRMTQIHNRRLYIMDFLKRMPAMAGRGLFDRIASTTGNLASKAGDFLRAKVQGTPQFETNLAVLSDAALDRFGYNAFDARNTEFLKAHGSEPITSLKIRRAPISNNINTALNLLSLGKWNESRAKYGYDDLFHLGLIVNDKYAIQRIGRVSVNFKDPDAPRTEFLQLPVPAGVTMSSMLEQTIQRVGPKIFFSYDPFTANCQGFLKNVLETIGLYTPEVERFVFQPVDALLREQPGYVQTIAHVGTNIGQFGGIGAGKRGREPTAEEAAAAEARADRHVRAARGEKRLSSIEQQLNELSQEMFGKDADELDDDENDQLDVAFRRQNGDHDDEEDEDEDEDDRTEVILKGKPSKKRLARAKRFMQKLKFPARVAQYKASLPFVKRRFNESMAARRADPDYDIPTDEDETDYEFDDDGAEEPPPFEPGTYFRRGGGTMIGRGVTREEAFAWLREATPFLVATEEAADVIGKVQPKLKELTEDIRGTDERDDHSRMMMLEHMIPFREQVLAVLKAKLPDVMRLKLLVSKTKPELLKAVEDEVEKMRVMDDPTSDRFFFFERMKLADDFIDTYKRELTEIPRIKELLMSMRKAFGIKYDEDGIMRNPPNIPPSGSMADVGRAKQ